VTTDPELPATGPSDMTGSFALIAGLLVLAGGSAVLAVRRR
jgi:LPXTG-motif cell wall-anchored protein